jgi:alpha-glucosidase
MPPPSQLIRISIANLLLALPCLAQHPSSVPVRSPDGSVVGHIAADRTGALHYSIDWNDKPFSSGTIGVIADGKDYGASVTLGTPRFGRIDESYPILGVKSRAENHAITVTVPLLQANRLVGSIDARAYNDGFAWRINIDGEGTKHVTSETSSWKLPVGTAWFGERNNAWKLKSYAGEYIARNVDDLPHASSQGPFQTAPIVIRLADGSGYELITEAALSRYSGMRLEAIGDRRLRVNFTEGDKGFDIAGPLQTPWRVTLVARDLDQLVNSDLIANLNPPPDPLLYADTAYIRAGRSVWRWWSRQTGTPDQEMQFVDYAVALQFEYTLIDDGWDQWTDAWRNLGRVCAYAKSRGVGVFAWKDYRFLSDPTGDWRQLHEFFDQATQAGLAGVKIDFLNAESKDRIDFERAALTIAAQHRMMIDFHGLQKPTGEQRTYPNEISSEAVRGIELNKMAEGPIPPSHNAALPFTRLIVGPADYTPLSLTWPGDTTWTHQVATAIAFTSPLLVIAEDPELLLRSADAAPALELIKSIPSTWDETHVLPGSSIGEIAILARRKGTIWYIAVLNGLKPSEVSLDLSLVIPSRPELLEVLSSPQKRSFHLGSSIVAIPPKLYYRLDSGDGLVVRISPTHCFSKADALFKRDCQYGN